MLSFSHSSCRVGLSHHGTEVMESIILQEKPFSQKNIASGSWVVCTLVILALERWGQEDQGFKVNLSYVISSRTVMVPEDLVLKNLY